GEALVAAALVPGRGVVVEPAAPHEVGVTEPPRRRVGAGRERHDGVGARRPEPVEELPESVHLGGAAAWPYGVAVIALLAVELHAVELPVADTGGREPAQ